MTWDLNAEGYRLLADLLLGMRRITARAADRLAKTGRSGGDWPDSVREVLAHHQMLERELPRHAEVDDDLMAFATFADLAALIRGEDSLKQLIDRLGSEPGEFLDRLDQLEEIRRDVAEARVLDPEVLEILKAHHDEIGRVVAGARSGGGGKSASRKGGRRDRRAVSTKAGRAPRGSDDVPEQEVASEIADAVDADPSEAPDGTASADAATVAPEAAIEDAAIRESIEIEHDAAVLAAMHAEVTAVAEDVFAGRPNRPIPGWNAIRETGWYDSRRDSRGLDPLATFYDTAGAWTEAATGGASNDELRTLLRDRGFSGLLLSLRDMFDRNRL
jgi:hypothetical protein